MVVTPTQEEAAKNKSELGRKSDAFQAEVREDVEHGTNRIVWRCGTCQKLIPQSDLQVRKQNGVTIHEAPVKCPWCGATHDFQLIDED
jgi:rubrerythrin